MSYKYMVLVRENNDLQQITITNFVKTALTKLV